jgi:hypothetical protein
LRCALRHCGVLIDVRLIPPDLRALHLGIFEREQGNGDILGLDLNIAEEGA